MEATYYANLQVYDGSVPPNGGKLCFSSIYVHFFVRCPIYVNIDKAKVVYRSDEKHYTNHVRYASFQDINVPLSSGISYLLTIHVKDENDEMHAPLLARYNDEGEEYENDLVFVEDIQFYACLREKNVYRRRDFLKLFEMVFSVGP